MSSYETERQTKEFHLNNIFNNKDENNFIDLSAIHAVVAPHDKRPTVRLLNSAKLQQVVQRIRGYGVEPIVETREKVMVHHELALEVVKAKRSDLKDFLQRWEGGDISLVICNTPEVLSRVKDVFGDARCIRHVKLDGKFYFAAIDLAKIALWEGNASELSNIPVYIQRASEKDEALKKALAKCHRFGPGQPSPILDITNAARLWLLLPGRRATVFRTEVIKTWVRVFAGDLTLVDEIIRNHAIQDSLPEDSPMHAFADEIPEKAAAHNPQKKKLPKQSRGYVYCVRPGRNIDIMKIGHWKSNLHFLEKRYKTYYGKDLSIHAKMVRNCREMEKQILDSFKENKLSGELFPRRCWEDIVKFIDNAS